MTLGDRLQRGESLRSSSEQRPCICRKEIEKQHQVDMQGYATKRLTRSGSTIYLLKCLKLASQLAPQPSDDNNTPCKVELRIYTEVTFKRKTILF